MRKIFLDCGANRGQSIIQAKKQFGNDIEIYSFEAVPVLYRKLKEKWSHDSNVHLFNNAVWDKHDKVKIFVSPDWSDSSTLFLEKNDRPINKDLYNEIESIDLAEFIKNNFTPEDYIILKLDIEGAEYDVLYRLGETEVISYINEFWGEYHPHSFPGDYMRQVIEPKKQFIDKKLAENNLEFKEWSAYIETEEEEQQLTLDSNNKMPLNELMINNLEEPEVLRNRNSEIKRFHIINYLIEKYNLVNYLEIGVFKGENIREIRAAHKDGVDPGAEKYMVPEVNYPITSDEFFKLIEGHDEIKYDIIFIDGLHHADQVTKDIQNSLKHLMPKGFIVMHDCNPPSYEAQLVPRQTIAWNGDTWKAFASFKMDNPDYKCCVIDTDFGVGVIQNTYTEPVFKSHHLHWNYLNDDRQRMLNLITWDEFKATY